MQPVRPINAEEISKDILKKIEDELFRAFSPIPVAIMPSKALGEPLTEKRLKELAHAQFIKELEPKPMTAFERLCYERWSVSMLYPQGTIVKVERI